MLIRDAEVDGRIVDVRCDGEVIAQVAPEIEPLSGEKVIDARAGVLLPGLHDHHMHLFALAAARQSLNCGPPGVTDATHLAAVLSGAPGEGWIRGIGYHESVAGMLVSSQLDRMESKRPVRIQHRSGKMWFLNTEAARALSLTVPDGQLFRQDALLRERLSQEASADFRRGVEQTSRELARYGVTGLTDTTPTNDPQVESLLAGFDLCQRVHLFGNESLGHGAVKVMLDDVALPGIDVLRERISAAHKSGRPVAIHCVTRTELVFAVSVLADVGVVDGDRLEHASVTDDAAMDLIARSGLTVVTQPNFLLERGRQYLDEVDEKDLPYLYRCRGFVDAGVRLGGGTDAPFGDANPWLAIRAAVSRATADGAIIGAAEALSPDRALALFTTPADDPGGKPRRVAPGCPADLCLLRDGWDVASRSIGRDDLGESVRLTVARGEITYRQPALSS